MKKYRILNTRRYKRLKADYLIKYHIPGHEEDAWVSNLKDISAGGVRFWTAEALPEQCLLSLHILMPALDREVHTIGRVLRIRPAKHGHFYYAAIRFLELSQDDQLAIDGFIEYLANTPEAPYLIDQHEVAKRHIGRIFS